MEQKLKQVIEVVNDLSKNAQFIPKKYEQFTLPIIKHNVTFHFTAIVKFNIIEKQFLQFAIAALPKYLNKEEIQQRLGITFEEMENTTNRLLQLHKIDVIEGEIHVKEMNQMTDLEEANNPNKFSKTFELYFEPVTEYIVDDLTDLVQKTESRMHPSIVKDSYNFKNCPILSDDTILQLYAQSTGEDLEKYFSSITIHSIETKAVETNSKIELMEFELIDSKQQQLIKRLYNPNQHKLVEFS